ncbi:MAG: ABC transporter ATP-binding protein [Elusimicrobia bacterium]|nr:ABC transporter ATP-binding protein [Elusimicrobiota bacterium]
MIRAVGVGRRYRVDGQAVDAVRDVSLEVAAGEFTAIAGPSGSGKTTFLNMVGGLDRPTSGEVWLEQARLDVLGASELSSLRRRRLGFVFQSYNLIPVLSALENVELGLMLRGAPAAARSAQAAGALARVGLSGLEGRVPAQLSGGQQQRVAVARAVAGSPALVIADEPTANLDSKTADELLALFEMLNADSGVTFLFSSHDPAVLARARRVVTFHDGRVVKDTLNPV